MLVFFLFQWLWATLWRKVCVIIYYLPFNFCVKGLTNILAEIAEVFGVIFLKVHPLSVFPSCSCTLLRYSACCTFWVHWEMLSSATVWAEHGNALIPVTQEKLCVSVHTHMPLLPFPFTFLELILQAKQKILVPICSPPGFFHCSVWSVTVSYFWQVLSPSAVPTNRSWVTTQ